MLEFLALASSSNGCCYRLSGGGADSAILIDAGIRFELIQQGIDFQISSLGGCLVSHAHGDHVKAVKKLMDASLDCYASSETWEQMEKTIGRHHRSRTVTELKEFDVRGGWRVLPFDAVHDMPGTLGFVIGSPDGFKALYLTDSAYSRYTFQGLTHIYIECNFSQELLRENVENGKVHAERFARTQRTHMSLERLIQMLKSNDLSKVEEIHLLHLSSANSDELGFKKAIERATGCPVYVADEFSKVTF